VVVIAVAALTGGGDSKQESAGGAGARPAKVDVALIKRRVERMRGLRFRRPLSITFATPQRAQEIIEKATKSRYTRRDQLIDEEEMKLLGLLPASDHIDRYLNAIEKEQVLGFYDDRRKRLVVVREPGASRPLLEITLAHELTHALEDQRFRLRAGGTSDDATLAESTLAEGTATVVMAEYAVRYFGIDDALELLESASRGDTKLPAFVEDVLIFPYEQGVEFVEAFRPSGSWKALDNVIRFRRPTTAEQVIHPSKYAIDERAVSVALPDLGLVLGPAWRRLGSSSVGEVDLRELFKVVGRKPDPDAAAGWGGGRFELWRRSHGGSCAAPCVEHEVGAMALAWDTGGDRRVAEETLARAFRIGLRARPLDRDVGGRRWSSRGGVIAMKGAGRRTAVVLAPDSRTAARVLAQLV
jgi:hypothetical protein